MSKHVKGPISLAQYMESFHDIHSMLPSFHNTHSENLEPILASGTLKPSNCTVFKEALVYLFYGRPAYRSRYGNSPNTEVQYCPVCFVLRTEKLNPKTRRVYPFDSGAAYKDMFDPPVKKNEAMNYELAPTIEAACKFIFKFFETKEDYFAGDPRPGLAFSAEEVAAKDYYDLVCKTGGSEFDDRRSAVELQYSDEIALKDSTWAIVLPFKFLKEKNLREAVCSLGAYPITYSTYRGMTPSHFAVVIRQYVEDWIRKGGGFE